jgi:hypothetical protein
VVLNINKTIKPFSETLEKWPTHYFQEEFHTTIQSKLICLDKDGPNGFENSSKRELLFLVG